MRTFENDCSGFLLNLCCHNQHYQLILEPVNETSVWMIEDPLNISELENHVWRNYKLEGPKDQVVTGLAEAKNFVITPVQNKMGNRSVHWRSWPLILLLGSIRHLFQNGTSLLSRSTLAPDNVDRDSLKWWIFTAHWCWWCCIINRVLCIQVVY
jgi:hypothetical protein